MIFPRVEIREVADINPRLESKPADGDTISFVPMAAVSELTVSIERPVDRPYREVAKGFTAFQRGDIIIAKITPCFENGKMAHAVDLPRQIGFGSTEFHVLRPKSTLVGRYLFQLLKRPDIRTDGARKMQGAAGQRRVPADFFGKLQIPLPPLAEQKRIAAILDAADALRTKRREALAQLDTLLQSTFLTLFGDPVGNPKKWKSCSVGEVTDCIVPGRDKPKSFSGGIPWITTDALQRLETTFISSKGMGLNAAEIAEVRARVIPAGSVIISCVGDLGIVSIAGKDMVINQQLHSFQCHETMNNIFLMHCLVFQEAFMYAKASSTTLPYMNKTVCNSIPVIAPPLPLQQKFTTIVESVERQKAAQRTHLAELDTLFAALQHRAFRGEL